MIVHVDGDAFFASCEQAVNPVLRGKPVVTGKERNIVAAASYEAKALGIERGVALWEAKKKCPELIVLPSDYETYSLFSKRMFDIMRRYTPTVEEYSIDEGFADLTGLRRVHHASYPLIAQRLQAAIHQELGITVSVGLSLTKTLAKVASRHHKPAGFTVISRHDRVAFLHALPVGSVWNIGPNTAALLTKYGMPTAGVFTERSYAFLGKILHKPGLETWQELNGVSVWPVTPEAKQTYQSISKTKTFTPPSNDRAYVYAQLMKNVENACIKARRHQLAPRKIIIYLKYQNFSSRAVEAMLARPSAFPLELNSVVHELFEKTFEQGALYRATGVVLVDLVTADTTQLSLFEAPQHVTKIRQLYEAIDELKTKYGKHAVHQAASLSAQSTAHLTSRGDLASRKQTLLLGETKRRRLPLPLIVT